MRSPCSCRTAPCSSTMSLRCGACQGARGMGRDRDRRRRVRPDPRRRSDPVVLVAVDLLRQRPGRHRRVPALVAPRARVERRDSAGALRHRRRRHRDRRADVARVRDRARRDRRMDVVDDDRLLRPLGDPARELRRDRDAVDGAARPTAILGPFSNPLLRGGLQHGFVQRQALRGPVSAPKSL